MFLKIFSYKEILKIKFKAAIKPRVGHKLLTDRYRSLPLAHQFFNSLYYNKDEIYYIII